MSSLEDTVYTSSAKNRPRRNRKETEGEVEVARKNVGSSSRTDVNPVVDYEDGSKLPRKGSKTRHANWPVKETVGLLLIRRELSQKQTGSNTSSMRLNLVEWDEIASELKGKGFKERSGTQVSERWGTLRSIFWAIEDYCSATAKTLDQVLREKNVTIRDKSISLPVGYTKEWHNLIREGNPGKKRGGGAGTIATKGPAVEEKISDTGQELVTAKGLHCTAASTSKLQAYNITPEFSNLFESIVELLTPSEDGRMSKLVVASQSLISAMQSTPTESESCVFEIDKKVLAKACKMVLAQSHNIPTMAPGRDLPLPTVLLGRSQTSTMRTSWCKGCGGNLNLAGAAQSASHVDGLKEGTTGQGRSKMKIGEISKGTFHVKRVEELLKQAISDHHTAYICLTNPPVNFSPSPADTASELSPIGHSTSVHADSIEMSMLDDVKGKLTSSFNWCQCAINRIQEVNDLERSLSTELASRLLELVKAAEEYQERIISVFEICGDEMPFLPISTVLPWVQNSLTCCKCAVQELKIIIALNLENCGTCKERATTFPNQTDKGVNESFTEVYRATNAEGANRIGCIDERRQKFRANYLAARAKSCVQQANLRLKAFNFVNVLPAHTNPEGANPAYTQGLDEFSLTSRVLQGERHGYSDWCDLALYRVDQVIEDTSLMESVSRVQEMVSRAEDHLENLLSMLVNCRSDFSQFWRFLHPTLHTDLRACQEGLEASLCHLNEIVLLNDQTKYA